ncbi:MAG: YkvA family protein [Pseudomonadota bacterium]
MPETIAKNEKTVKAKFWNKIGRIAARVPFAEDALAAYYCAMDSNTPTYVKGILLAALAYFIMPLDALPDILPFLGFTDDAAVIAIALTKIRQHMKPEHREQARSKLDELKGGELKEAKA